MEYDKKDLGVRIAKRRADVGMSASELAEKVGVSKSYINNLESGNYFTPSINKLFAIAEALSTTPDRLLEGNLKIFSCNNMEGVDKDLSNLFYTLPLEAKECFLNILRSYALYKEYEEARKTTSNWDKASEFQMLLDEAAKLNEKEIQFVIDNLKLSLAGIKNMKNKGDKGV